MKTVYEAKNTIDAHLILNLLQQEGITAHIQGAYLQGGVGGLPATGLVRILVSADDFEKAHSIIDEWEATPSTNETIAQQKDKPSNVLWYIFFFALGVVFTYTALRLPISNDGIDHNDDRKQDEKFTYSLDGILQKTEADRNFDGKIDYISHLNTRGSIESAEADDDFNGTFETEMRFQDGNINILEVDTNGNGVPDIRTNYVYGVQNNVESINQFTGHPFRIEHTVLGQIRYAETDTNNDGILDTRITYNEFAEVVKNEKIATQK